MALVRFLCHDRMRDGSERNTFEVKRESCHSLEQSYFSKKDFYHFSTEYKTSLYLREA